MPRAQPYQKGRKLYQSAFFWISRTGATRPVDIKELVDFMNATSTITKIDEPAVRKLLLDVAQYIIDRIREDVRRGRIKNVRRVSRLTHAKKGHGHPLYDTGQLVNSLKAYPARKSQAGHLGLNVAVDTALAKRVPHVPRYPFGIPIDDVVQLWNIVTRTGALIDLSNEGVRKRVFGFYRALGLLEEEPRQRVRGKPYIWIPPRPIFTEEYLKELQDEAFEKVLKPRLGRAFQVMIQATQYGPLAPGDKEEWIRSRWRALMAEQEHPLD